MENIIQQIAEKLIHKILERAYSGGISDIDACQVMFSETAEKRR